MSKQLYIRSTRRLLKASIFLALIVILAGCIPPNPYMEQYFGGSSSVTVIVVKRYTSSPMEDIHVGLKGKYNDYHRYGITDSKGKAYFNNVPTGSYTIFYSEREGPMWRANIEYSGGSKSYEVSVP